MFDLRLHLSGSGLLARGIGCVLGNIYLSEMGAFGILVVGALHLYLYTLGALGVPNGGVLDKFGCPPPPLPAQYQYTTHFILFLIIR